MSLRYSFHVPRSRNRIEVGTARTYHFCALRLNPEDLAAVGVDEFAMIGPRHDAYGIIVAAPLGDQERRQAYAFSRAAGRRNGKFYIRELLGAIKFTPKIEPQTWRVRRITDRGRKLLAIDLTSEL